MSIGLWSQITGQRSLHFDMINESEFFAYAVRHYDNPSCKTTSEFNEDLNRFKHLRKTLIRYCSGDDVNPQLILNHVVVLLNVFDQYACVRMMFERIEHSYWSPLKTILSFLNVMPNDILECGIISKEQIKDDLPMLIFLESLNGSAND